jgi:hypothetical protein
VRERKRAAKKPKRKPRKGFHARAKASERVKRIQRQPHQKLEAIKVDPIVKTIFCPQ